MRRKSALPGCALAMYRNFRLPNVKPTVVITGARGFVGAHFARELATTSPDFNVVSWDQPEVDITQPGTYRAQLAKLQPEWVVHLAAIAAVGLSLHHPALTHEVNVAG